MLPTKVIHSNYMWEIIDDEDNYIMLNIIG